MIRDCRGRRGGELVGKLGMQMTPHQPRKRRPANRPELSPYESSSVADVESLQTKPGKHLDLGNRLGERDAGMNSINIWIVSSPLHWAPSLHFYMPLMHCSSWFKIVKPFTTLLFQFEAGIMRWLTCVSTEKALNCNAMEQLGNHCKKSVVSRRLYNYWLGWVTSRSSHTHTSAHCKYIGQTPWKLHIMCIYHVHSCAFMCIGQANFHTLFAIFFACWILWDLWAVLIVQRFRESFTFSSFHWRGMPIRTTDLLLSNPADQKGLSRNADPQSTSLVWTMGPHEFYVYGWIEVNRRKHAPSYMLLAAGECDGVGLLQTKGKEETAADCRGFEKCPEWPMPYHSGIWADLARLGIF